MFRDEKKLVETPMIPISLGELFDKITILEIKLEQITNKRALKNVNREYNLLLAIYKKDFSGNNGANQLMIKLKLINQKLWIKNFYITFLLEYRVFVIQYQMLKIY